MKAPIDKLTIRGFKSIKALENFELRSLNVLIGANGAGKSNFISFFRMLRELIEQRLQLFIKKSGGSDRQLYLGPKQTKTIVGQFYFNVNGYGFSLEPTADNRLVFAEETLYFEGVYYNPTLHGLGSGHEESKLRDAYLGKSGNLVDYVYPAVSSWVVYHFHDTSDSALVKRPGTIRDNEYFRPNADNLAAFLYRLKNEEPTAYEQIKNTVRLIAPFFSDFKLRPMDNDLDQIQLEWLQVGTDFPFHANQLSDGTLRFICLCTALLQPVLPSTILIDEPELGLHPYALTLLASLIKQAATRTQVIVSTQSAPLLDHFEPEDVIVVEMEDQQSIFKRLDREGLEEWLEEYSLGDLWRKNIIGGRPGK